MMNEQLKKYIDPIKNFWGKLTKKSKRIIFIVLGGVVVISIVLSLLMNKTQYVVLYPGLDSDEATEVMTKIQNDGISCKDDGGTIYVPSDKEDSLRMELSNEGHPKTAPNYDFFTNNVNTMTTDDERKIIEKYQLQQRLEAVIKTLDPINTAYVTITVPETSTYVWDENKENATASVTLKLKTGKTLSAKQVSGIRNLVATSVPNLSAENVSITDSSGEALTSDSSDASGETQMDLSEFKLKIEKQYEDNIEKKIADLLSPTYGEKNISVSVKSQMDLDKKVQDIITYKPTTSDNKGIPSKSQETHEETKDTSSGGGVAGTQSNSDTTTTTYPGVTVNGNTITTKDSKTYEYLVSKVQEQVQSDAASLQDLTVSVIINTQAMTDATKQDITSAVANAAGVNSAKVVVLGSSFATSQKPVSTTPKQMLPIKYMIIAGGALLILLILLAVMIIVAKRKKRQRMIAERLGQGGEVDLDGLGGAENEEPIPTESIEELRSQTGGKEEQVQKDLKEFSSQNPEIAAQLIRNWLKGEDDDDQ